jgi:predicted nucleic acid-binding protein
LANSARNIFRSKKKQYFLKLKKILSDFPDLPLAPEDFESAAEYFNNLRSKGIQGSNIDFLICSVSTRNNMPIFSIDNDWVQYEKVIRLSALKGRYIPAQGNALGFEFITNQP